MINEEDDKYIAITHFINPHQFWYTCTENDGFSEVINLEEDLTKRYMNSLSGTTRTFTPTEGSVVAVQYMSHKKRFIRGRIEKKLIKYNAKPISYIVFAIDHGFPFETSEEYIRYLPEELTFKIDRVHCGGIAKIVPAEDGFDFLDQRTKTEIKNKWHNNACDLLERMLIDAASISFSETLKSTNGHCWGDLHIVNHRGIIFRASDYLINKKYAIRNCAKFIDMCIESDQTQLPVWESNSGNIKYGKNKCPTLDSMLELDTKTKCLPNKDELQSAKLKIAAWSAHNEKATNYCGSNNSEHEEDAVYDDSNKKVSSRELKEKLLENLEDSVSVVCNTYNDFKNMDLTDKGINAKTGNHSTPTLSFVDFSIEEEIDEKPQNDQKNEDTSSQFSSISKKTSLSSRSRFLLEMRKKQMSKHNSRNVELGQNKNPESIEIKTDDEAKRSSISETSEPKHEVPLQNDDSIDKNSITANRNIRSSDRTRYLNFLRTRNIPPASSTQSDQPSTTNSSKLKSAIQKLRSQNPENMIPAGFDLTNLNTYRDKNHWHLKTTTRNDKKGNNLSQSLDSENHQQDFRFTRENTDKYKISKGKENTHEEMKLDHKQENEEEEKENKSVEMVKANSPKEDKSSFAVKKITSTPNTPNEKVKLSKEKFSSPLNERCELKINKNCSIIKESSLLESSDNSDESTYSSALSDLEEDFNKEQKKKIITNFIIKSTKKKEIPMKKNDFPLNSEESIGNRIPTDILKRICKSTSHDHQITIEHNEKLVRMNFTEHLVLAHSQIQLYTADKLENVFLAPIVIDEMKKMFIDKVYRVQSYAWSHMISGNGLFIVNSPNSGKTWSYIPTLCSSITFDIQNCMTPTTYGPIAIVIVSSSEKAITIGNILSRLLYKLDSTDAKIVISYGLQNLIKTKIQLMESCAILVTTPTNLLHLMESNKRNEPLFNPTRIQHIIIDDIDEILSRTSDEFNMVFKKLCALVPKVNESKRILPQLVVTSRMYQPIIPKLISISNQPLLLIGDFMEAAVYGKANIEMQISQKDYKMNLILEFIKKHSVQHERLLILCNCESDVIFVVEQLMVNGILSFGFHKKSPLLVRHEVEDWKVQPIPTKVLVCSDDVFPELEIQSAQNLIHYSLANTWTKFVFRFISLINIYENLIVKGFNRPSPENSATSLILLDEDNNNELPRLIEFLQNHDQTYRIPSQVLQLSKNIKLQRETKRCGDNKTLCNSLFEFGECSNNRCENRHVLSTNDFKQDNVELLQYGDIRFSVLNVFSPTHFSVKLLEHRATTNSKWKIVRESNESTIFAIRFNCFYDMETDNIKLHWPVKINDICVYKKKRQFYRARIINAPEIKSENVIKTLQLKLRLIDTGEIIHCQSDEIYILNDEFRDFPPQSVDIHLIGIKPYGNERNYDPDATNHVKNLIKDNLDEYDSVYASINFSLSDAICVESVLIMETLPDINTVIYKDSLKRSLIKKNYAIKDGNIVTKIHNLLKEQGFDYILDKTQFENDSNNSINSENNDLIEAEEKVEIPENATQNQSISSEENPSDDHDKDVVKISNENCENNSETLTETSTTSINEESTQIETSISESSLPAVCDFNELIMCIQRSIALDAEEYIENGDTSSENIEEFIRQTEQYFKMDYESNEKTEEIDGKKENFKKHETLKIEEIYEPQKDLNNCNKELQKKNENLEVPRLLNLHERPPTVWYQTNYLIILSIHAPDINDYYLEIGQSYLYFNACVNGVEKVLVLNFLGTIEPNLVSHEIRGLNVAVRLVKSLYIMWPRLVKQEEKIPWLTYNLNMINTKEMENLLPQQFVHNVLKSNLNGTSNDSDEDSMDSDDNEIDSYGTYNPIINKEDFIDSEMI